jgi:hypothetical protein
MDRVIRDGMERSGMPGFAVARARPRRLVVAVAGVGVRAGAALPLVALPALTLGWRPLLLWQPDLATVLALLAGLLLLSAGLRLATLVRRARTAPDDRAEPTVGDPTHEPAVPGAGALGRADVARR